MDFSDSGIKRIGNLKITAVTKDGKKAKFTGCPGLRLPITFVGSEYEMDDSAREEILKRIAAAKAVGATPDLEI